ncbi:MAG: dienelactone hydrolase family protein [Bacteriovoracaceae bacterium]
MKLLMSLMTAVMLTTGCAHKKDKKQETAKESYSPIISYQEEGKTFESSVSLPKEMKDKVPLIVIVHEWWGRNDYIMKRSQMLNDIGYATLPVDLYGNGQVVQTPQEATALATPFYQNPMMGVERLNKYISMAQKDPHVDASQIYVIGYCFGGTQALNLARSGADVKGVVSFHGGLESSLKSQGIKAKVLAMNGLADKMVPAKQRTGFEKEMKDLKADYKIVNYKGAMHAFTNPNATAIGKQYKIPIAYNKKADEDSWKQLMEFLKK